MHMEAVRAERTTVNLTPELLRQLDRFAGEHRWPRSTAAVVLIERGLGQVPNYLTWPASMAERAVRAADACGMSVMAWLHGAALEKLERDEEKA